jgi:hypothetical protein
MSASEPDPVQQRWVVRIWTNFRGNIHAAEYIFWSEVKHVDEAFELLYACGFACVRKNYLGQIVPNGKFEVRLSTGEL